MQWLHPSQAPKGLSAILDTNKSLLEGFRAMLHHYLMPQSVVFSKLNDDKLEDWKAKAKKWAHLLVLNAVSCESQCHMIQVNFIQSKKLTFPNMKSSKISSPCPFEL